jgi:hypothetical protein
MIEISPYARCNVPTLYALTIFSIPKPQVQDSRPIVVLSAAISAEPVTSLF